LSRPRERGLRATYKVGPGVPGKEEVEKDLRDYQAFSLALSGRSSCSDEMESSLGVLHDSAVGSDGGLLGSSKGSDGVVEGSGGVTVVLKGNHLEVVHDSAVVESSSLGTLGTDVVDDSSVVDASSSVLSLHGSLGVGNGLSEVVSGNSESVVGNSGVVVGVSPGLGPFGDDSLGMGRSARPHDSHVSSVHPVLSGVTHSSVGTGVLLDGSLVVSVSLSGGKDGFLELHVPHVGPLGLDGLVVLSSEVLDGLVTTSGNVGKVLFDPLGSLGNGRLEGSLIVEEGEVTEASGGGDGSESADGSDFAEHIVD